MRAVCEEHITASTRAGMEGGRGISSLCSGVGVRCLVGLWFNKEKTCNPEFTASSPITCACGFVGWVTSKVSSRYGEVWLIIVGIKFDNALEESWPCFFGVCWLPAWLPIGPIACKQCIQILC
eukprot:scaffold164279_cov21-Tisochrysis_lutea.AAC.1